MKYIITTALLLLSVSIQAATVRLTFENGWAIDFDDTITNTTNNTFGTLTQIITYGTPNINVDNAIQSDIFNTTLLNVINPTPTGQDRISFTEFNLSGNQFNSIWSDTSNPNITFTTNIIDFIMSTIGITDFYNVQRRNNLTQLNDLSNTTLASVHVVPTPPAIWLMATAITGLMVRKKIIALA